MADYRKSLMDMTPEERAEVAPGFVPSDDVSTPLSVKVADEAISLATPIDSIVEIQQELAKDEPDYLKIGMLGGMEAIGLLAPGAGKAAQSMIRKGADIARQTDNVVDVASNIPQVPRSVTPSYTDEALLEADDILTEWGKGNLTNPQLRKAMSDKGFKIETKTISPKMTADDIEVVGPDGNIVRWKDMPRGTGAIDTTKGSIEAAGLTDEAIDAWRKANATSEEFRKALKGRNPELQDLANKIDDPDSPITVEDYRVRADEIRPIRKVTDVPKPATYKEVVSALNAGKRKKPMIGLNAEIPDGDVITARLDIDAYTDYDVWVPTLTHPDLKTVYKPTVVLKDVSFIDESSSALKKAKGVAQGKAKAPFAVMTGKYQNMSNDEAYEYATSVFDSDEWVQAGYDPTKRGFFYDRADGQPILAGDEVIQVGHLVLVKNATKGDAKAFSFNEGGMAMDEQMDAVFKSSRTGYAEGGEVGAAPDTTIGVDPVSGNEVPMGATPEEVRDDIPAQLSEGEYVVPADVVRYYGVKFFEDLRAEAKQGWASMEANGRVGGEPVEATGMEMGQDELPFDISELQVVEMNEGGFLGGYDEGGSVTTTSLTGSPFATNKVTTKKYVDGQGNVRYVTFSGDTPLSYIPPEFKEEGTEEAAPTTTTEAAPAPVQQDDGPDIDYDYYESLRREANKFNPETAAFEDYQKELDKASGKAGSVIAGGIASIGLGPIAGIGISKLIDNENRKRLENLRDATENKVSELQGSSTTVDQVSPYADLLTDINNILEGKETEQPKSIAELLGFASKNETGVPSENKGVFSSMLDNIKTSLSEATSWDDDKWKKTGLSEEFSTLKGRDPNRSALWGSEQEALAGAIRSGNDDVVRHYEIINEHRKAAERYRQGKSTGSTFLSKATMDRIDKEEAEKKKKNK